MSSPAGSNPHASTAGPAPADLLDVVFPGDTEMARRCRGHDWGASPLGPVAGWSASLRTAVGLCLAAPGPMCLAWGPRLALLYNDAYRALVGAAQHPAALGRPMRELWREIWDQLEPDVVRAMAGGPAVAREDDRFVLRRDGREDETFVSHAFVPVRDERGEVGGVMHVLTDTTPRVRAEATLRAERERLAAMVLALPAPVALHWGPEHRLAVVNAAFQRVSGGRDVTGLTPAEAFPDVVGQGILERFDEVARTGTAWVAREVFVRYDRLGLGLEDAWFDLRYEPVRDPDGRVVGVLNFSTDVTEPVRARREVERLLAESEAARAALAATEARFRIVQDASPLGFAIHRPVFGPDGAVADFAIPYVNEAGARIVGLTRAAILESTLLRVWPATADEGVFADYVRVLETGEPSHRELLYEHADFVGGLALTAVRIGEGASAELGITFTDVTTRLRAERERERLLADTEAARAAADLERRRLEAVLEHLPVGVHVAEAPSGRLVLDNSAVRAICGESPRSEGVAAYSGDYAGHYPPGHPRAGEALASEAWPLARTLATGAPVGEELVEIRRADGTRRLVGVSAAPVRDAAEHLVGAVATSVDLTERERLRADERAARERAERLQALTAALSAARTGADVARVITHEGRRVFGADGAGVALLDDGDRTFRYLAHDGVPADVAAAWATFPSTPETPYGHAVAARAPLVFASLDDLAARFPAVREPSARQGIATMIVVPLLGSDGRALGAAHLSFGAPRDSGAREAARDVASVMAGVLAVAQQCAQALERARLFEAERAARADAEAANRAKSEFLAVMSHELRTPLNAIGGYTELLELGIHGPVTDAQRTALGRIQASQRHLLGLIAGVLDYSRVEAGAVTYRLVAVPVTEAVAEAETLVAPQLRAKGLGYAWSGAAPGLCVRADREKLQQILLNLLSNAVKFTDARDGVPGRIAVACDVDARGHVRIRVRDSGVGIAAGDVERVFEPFVQADQRLTRAHAGVGLGLAISRDLARGMGGDLTVESVPGEGSTFTLTMPRA